MHKEKKERFQIQNRSTASTSLNILFFHNTMPEYRIGWFCELAKKANVDYVFTNEDLNKKDYGFEIEYDRAKKLKCTFLSNGVVGFYELTKIIDNIEKYDFVELPPLDSIREVVYSAYIVFKCKTKNVKIGYFWEKWDAPINEQPLSRRFKNLILRNVPGKIYRRADLIFSVGTKSKDYFLSNGVQEEKIRIIPDASETPNCESINIREKYNIPNSSKVILYLGRMMKQKGVEVLIEAFSSLDVETKKNSYLLIAGDGENLENCKKLSRKLQIRNIKFVGSVNPSIRGNYFKQCDIFVYPVIYYKGRVDVWGLTLIEAIQYGKVIIATDAVGSSYELIEDGVNGFRIEAGNVKAMRNAIICAMSESMKLQASKKDMELFQMYNYNNMAQKYIDAVLNY